MFSDFDKLKRALKKVGKEIAVIITVSAEEDKSKYYRHKEKNKEESKYSLNQLIRILKFNVFEAVEI